MKDTIDNIVVDYRNCTVRQVLYRIADLFGTSAIINALATRDIAVGAADTAAHVPTCEQTLKMPESLVPTVLSRLDEHYAILKELQELLTPQPFEQESPMEKTGYDRHWCQGWENAAKFLTDSYFDALKNCPFCGEEL